MARCQRVDYREQFVKYGVRLFDLRVWFDNALNLQVCHGQMVFDATSSYQREFLEYLNSKNGCYVRVILEEDTIRKTDRMLDKKECAFMEFCKKIEEEYPFIHFFGGNRKCDWKVLYDFGTKEPMLDDKYSSTTSLFRSKNRWLSVLDDLFPWLYARLHNRENIAIGTEKDWLFIDFVDIR